MERKKQKLAEEAEKSKSKMRILCDVCEKAEATIICSADEAALCSKCDIEVHEANMLANKHQRVPLINSVANSPRCDICQEKTGYFFCMEDRALLCRSCDVSIHTINPISAKHQRFLVTGARVALTALERPGSPRPASGALLTPSSLKATVRITQKCSELCTEPSLDKNQATEKPDTMKSNVGSQSLIVNLSRKSNIPDPVPETFPGWRVDELLNFPDMPSCFSFGDMQSNSKGDSTNFGDSDWAADTCFTDEEVSENCPHEVPKMPSPPTVSGLSRSKRISGPEKHRSKDDIFNSGDFSNLIVPDLDIISNP